MLRMNMYDTSKPLKKKKESTETVALSIAVKATDW